MSERQQIQKILFATDFSEATQNAKQYAFELAERLDVELHLLHVVVPVAVPILGAPSVGYIEDTQVVNELETSARREMESMFDPTKSTVRVVTAVCVGTPVFEIVRYANDQKIDMIVLGTTGRTGLTHLLLGSVAEEVVRKAHCPVLTVRHAAAAN